MMVCDINKFCYVCGKFVPRNEKPGVFSSILIKSYRTYFLKKVIRNKSWVPNIVCKRCYNRLMEWKQYKRRTIGFTVPMIWLNPVVHDPPNCYACVNQGALKNKILRKEHNYISVKSAQIPTMDIVIEEEEDGATKKDSECLPQVEMDVDFELSDNNEPILISQNELDYIVAKLELTKKKSEELASFLYSKKVLERDVRVTSYRNRQSVIQTQYVQSPENNSAHCPDVTKLMEIMEIKYHPKDWRLFIDSSKTSLKAVLLHTTNKKPSIPVAFSTETKETYSVLKTILEKIDYKRHNWKICCDLKIVAMLTGLQGGYTKRMCFICDWDSRYGGDQYKCHDWKSRETSEFKRMNVVEDPLVSKDNIILPPLHIKLGVVKNFITNVSKFEPVFSCLKKIFPKLSDCKIKNGIL